MAKRQSELVDLHADSDKLKNLKVKMTEILRRLEMRQLALESQISEAQWGLEKEAEDNVRY